jgi:hypothetical protein
VRNWLVGGAVVCLSSPFRCHSADLGMPGERSPYGLLDNYV